MIDLARLSTMISFTAPRKRARFSVNVRNANSLKARLIRSRTSLGSNCGAAAGAMASSARFSFSRIEPSRV